MNMLASPFQVHFDPTSNWVVPAEPPTIDPITSGGDDTPLKVDPKHFFTSEKSRVRLGETTDVTWEPLYTNFHEIRQLSWHPGAQKYPFFINSCRRDLLDIRKRAIQGPPFVLTQLATRRAGKSSFGSALKYLLQGSGVHLRILSASYSDIGKNYRILFYDTFGESLSGDVQDNDAADFYFAQLATLAKKQRVLLVLDEVACLLKVDPGFFRRWRQLAEQGLSVSLVFLSFEDDRYTLRYEEANALNSSATLNVLDYQPLAPMQLADCAEIISTFLFSKVCPLPRAVTEYFYCLSGGNVLKLLLSLAVSTQPQDVGNTPLASPQDFFAHHHSVEALLNGAQKLIELHPKIAKIMDSYVGILPDTQVQRKELLLEIGTMLMSHNLTLTRAELVQRLVEHFSGDGLTQEMAEHSLLRLIYQGLLATRFEGRVIVLSNLHYLQWFLNRISERQNYGENKSVTEMLESWCQKYSVTVSFEELKKIDDEKEFSTMGNWDDYRRSLVTKTMLPKLLLAAFSQGVISRGWHVPGEDRP